MHASRSLFFFLNVTLLNNLKTFSTTEVLNKVKVFLVFFFSLFSEFIVHNIAILVLLLGFR